MSGERMAAERLASWERRLTLAERRIDDAELRVAAIGQGLHEAAGLDQLSGGKRYPGPVPYLVTVVGTKDRYRAIDRGIPGCPIVITLVAYTWSGTTSTAFTIIETVASGTTDSNGQFAFQGNDYIAGATNAIGFDFESGPAPAGIYYAYVATSYRPTGSASFLPSSTFPLFNTIDGLSPPYATQSCPVPLLIAPGYVPTGAGSPYPAVLPWKIGGTSFPLAGTGMTATATVSGGKVSSITQTAAGSGYSLAYYPPGITITGGGGTGAWAWLNGLAGYPNQIYVGDGGSGYTSAPTIGIVQPYGPNLTRVTGPQSCWDWNGFTWMGAITGSYNIYYFVNTFLSLGPQLTAYAYGVNPGAGLKPVTVGHETDGPPTPTQYSSGAKNPASYSGDGTTEGWVGTWTYDVTGTAFNTLTGITTITLSSS